MKPVYKKFKIDAATTEKAFYNILELKDYIDFSVKRVYFAQDFKTEFIGGHCHKVEEELFIMTHGNCIAVLDVGGGLDEIPFRQGEALYVGNFVWHGFKNFSPGAVLLAASSTNYSHDRSDYIENYDEFKKR